MKQQVSPVVAVIVVLVVVAIAAAAWFKFGGSPQGTQAGQQPPPRPASVDAEFQKRLGGMTGPAGGGTKTLGAPAASGK